MGVFVQWGRKDGFPGADGSTITQTSGIEQNAKTIQIYDSNENTLAEGSSGVRLALITTDGVLNGNTSLVYTIKNPLIFIYGGNLYDWYTPIQSYQNNTLWGNNKTKSTYDPCPKGWKIPQGRTWDDFTSDIVLYFSEGVQSVSKTRVSTNGVRYNSFVWYPAEGLFDFYYTNALCYVGKDCYIWSSNAYNSNANYFLANMEGAYPSSNNLRANGMSVRCIQE